MCVPAAPLQNHSSDLRHTTLAVYFRGTNAALKLVQSDDQYQEILSEQVVALCAAAGAGLQSNMSSGCCITLQPNSSSHPLQSTSCRQHCWEQSKRPRPQTATPRTALATSNRDLKERNRALKLTISTTNISVSLLSIRHHPTSYFLALMHITSTPSE